MRLPGLETEALRVVLDSHLRLPLGSRLATGARDLPTLAIAGPDAPGEAAKRLADLGVVIERVGLDGEGHVDLAQAMRALSARGVTRVFSEGGPRVAARLIASGLADEVALFTAERPLGRPGYPALTDDARAALHDPGRYRLVRTAAYGPTPCGSGSGGTRWTRGGLGVLPAARACRTARSLDAPIAVAMIGMSR